MSTIPRQTERRAMFFAALNAMPRFETWTTEDWNAPTRTVAINNYTSMYGEAFVEKSVAVEPPRIRQHVKLIPRSVRRDMARKLSQRKYRVDHYLLEPR